MADHFGPDLDQLVPECPYLTSASICLWGETRPARLLHPATWMKGCPIPQNRENKCREDLARRLSRTARNLPGLSISPGVPVPLRGACPTIPGRVTPHRQGTTHTVLSERIGRNTQPKEENVESATEQMTTEETKSKEARRPVPGGHQPTVDPWPIERRILCCGRLL